MEVTEMPLTTDMFGQTLTKFHQFSRTFLSANLNCRTYSKVLDKITTAMDATNSLNMPKTSKLMQPK